MLSSTNDDGTEDNPDDCIYRLQMLRKWNPANLIAGFLNINSIRNKFPALQHILCNPDLLGVYETNSMILFLMVDIMLMIMYYAIKVAHDTAAVLPCMYDLTCRTTAVMT